MLPLLALTLTIFVGGMLLGIDLSRLRAEAENAQRVANAAALAGVIFLPSYPNNAYDRAREEARKNGFNDGHGGVSVTPSLVPGYNYRLKVSVAEPVRLFFGQLLGLGPQTISRSAVAEFFEPLQAGAPDNVLGYAPFPTTLVTGTAPEGFYLENKGPFTFKESGDAFTPFFESFSGPKYASPSDLPSGSPNPGCGADPTTGNCSSGGIATTPNLDHFSTNFNGYDYIVDDPLTNTLVIKLFDPYDEVAYNDAAYCWDTGKWDPNYTNSIGSSPGGSCGVTAHGTNYAPDNSNGNALGADSTQVPMTATVNPGACVLGSSGSSCRTKLIDQNSSPSHFGSHAVTLEFSLYGPSLSAYDPNMPLITATAPATDTSCSALNCVYQSPFNAGPDPTTCTISGTIPISSTSTTCSASPYAYRFLNYAIIHGPGTFRLNVRSVVNQPPIGDGAYGTRGNAFGIAVCADSSPTLGATSDPYTNSPVSPPTVANPSDAMGWNSASCKNPNGGAACPNPGLAQPITSTCVHVYGLGKMAIHNWLSQGTSIIPLGYIPPDYAGKTLSVRLYDVGDVSSGSAACPNGVVNCVEVLTPAGDTSHFDGALNNGFASSLPYSYGATPDYTPTGYIVASTVSQTSTVPIDVTSAKYNGSWLNITVDVPQSSTYAPMTQTFGGYWKVLYRIGGAADDATTWVISVAGSPVHLVQ